MDQQNERPKNKKEIEEFRPWSLSTKEPTKDETCTPNKCSTSLSSKKQKGQTTL